MSFANSRIFLLITFFPALSHAAGTGVRWEFFPDDGDYFASAPAVASDGTVYVGNQNGYLYSFAPSGKLKWQLKMHGGVHTPPAIAQDGTIYIGGWNCGLTAISPDGTIKWTFPAGVIDHGGISIGQDGTLYFASNHEVKEDGTIDVFKPGVYAVTREGAQKWFFTNEVGHYRKPVVTKDKIFTLVGDFFGIDTPKSELIALDLAGKLLWRMQGVTTDPAVGADGVLYAGGFGERLLAISAHGKVIWQTNVIGGVATTPSIDQDGTLYFGTDDGYVCAVKRSGQMLWVAESNGTVMHCGNMSDSELSALKEKWTRRKRREHPRIRFPVALDAKGNVIVAAPPGLIVFNRKGMKVAEFDLDGTVEGAPTLGSGPTIYVGTLNARFFALRGFAGLQKSAWPMYGRTAQHTSFAE